ncbi:MAG: hypothetical protein CMN31_13920 [Sandaracinus sp.]|nr:hypothetical protein [Myxococcales bacterium]MAT24461.1 hypothetical protein [Sandaracinus sp.]MBJ72411.1 hypothetical protein [Sandaracinus sp.]
MLLLLGLLAACASPASDTGDDREPAAAGGEAPADPTAPSAVPTAGPPVASPPVATPPTSAALPCGGDADAITDLSVGPAEVCAVVRGRLVCQGSRDREPAPLRVLEAPPDLRRVSTNGRRFYAVDAEGRLHRWDRHERFRPPEVVAEGVTDVFVGHADGSREAICLLTDSGEARCHRGVRGALGEPYWSVPDALEVQVLNRYFCVRTAGALECRPTHDFGDPDQRLVAEGATGLYWDYRNGCLLLPSGPVCTEGFDPSDAFGATRPVRALTGWLDARWGTCATLGDAVQCRMGDGWIRTTTFAGAPRELGMGKSFACALCGGTVSCWGQQQTLGTMGALARGPERVEGLEGVTGLYGGDGGAHGSVRCAELEGGALHCWGRGADGERDFPEPTEGFRREDVRRGGPCDLEGGRVRCEGRPMRGVRGAVQLVQGGSRARCVRTPEAVFCSLDEDEPVRFPVRGARDVATNANGELCVVTEAGGLRCGQVGPMFGALGAVAWERGEGLHAVEGITGAVAVTMDLISACVLHEDGGVSCFGSRGENRVHDGGLFAPAPIVIPVTEAE